MTSDGQTGPIESYEPFFGLSEPPFSLAPNPRFLFAGASHSAALALVAYALQRREPLIVVTGEIGTGKTLLCRTVLERLRRKTFLSVIHDPLLERDDLLKQMLEDFGVISKDRTRLTETSRHQLVETLHAFLNSLTPLDAHAVVIVDDAQHLQPDVLEQIRLMTNIDDKGGTLLQMILVGQKDLDALLGRPELRQLRQRVSRRILLEPLNGDEVAQYVEHRLATARLSRPLSQIPGANQLAQELAAWDGTKHGVEFTPDAMHAVSGRSGGVPRVINLLCDRSLEEAYASRLHTIDGSVIQKAARELGLEDRSAPFPADSDTITVDGRETEPVESIWTVTPQVPEATSEIADSAANATAVFRPSAGTADPSRLPRYLALAAAVAVAGAAMFYVLHPARSPEAQTSPSDPSSSAPRASDPQTNQAPAGVGTSTPPPPEASTPQPPAVPSVVAAPAAGERFDLVVASFRTDARATAVGAQVSALGLPIRRRVTDGWQQVISGPFASRTAAEDAQRRLDRAGLTGGAIVPAAP